MANLLNSGERREAEWVRSGDGEARGSERERRDFSAVLAKSAGTCQTSTRRSFFKAPTMGPRVSPATTPAAPRPTAHERAASGAKVAAVVTSAWRQFLPGSTTIRVAING